MSSTVLEAYHATEVPEISMQLDSRRPGELRCRRMARRKPSEDTAGVLCVCALLLAVRGWQFWVQADHAEAWTFFVRSALLVPAAVLIWRRRAWAVMATLVGDVLDGLRVIVHAIDATVFPSFLGFWVRVVLVWLLALCWRDLHEGSTP
jgi:hypothetical protein